jgi:Leucine-rich repeat (LRR) protein/uncharacterized membrane protein YgcG
MFFCNIHFLSSSPLFSLFLHSAYDTGHRNAEQFPDYIELLANSFKGQLSAEILTKSVQVFFSFASARDSSVPYECPGNGITWYAPIDEPCLNSSNVKSVPSVATNTTIKSLRRRPACEEFVVWGTGLMTLVVVGAVAVWLLLVGAAVVVVFLVPEMEARASSSSTKGRRKVTAIVGVGVLCFFIALVLFIASYQLLEYDDTCLSEMELLRLHGSHSVLSLFSCLICTYGFVGISSMWKYRHDQWIQVEVKKVADGDAGDGGEGGGGGGGGEGGGGEGGGGEAGRGEGGGAATATTTCVSHCSTHCFICCSLLASKAQGYYNAYDAWFSFERGHFYLVFMLVMEVVEMSNQAYQLFEFGGERHVAWVVGVSLTMLVGACLLPVPEIIARRGPHCKLTSKVVAALVDLLLDTIYLALALIVHQNSLQQFATGSWLIATSGFVFPALGAFKTLHEVSQEVCLLSSQEYYREVEAERYREEVGQNGGGVGRGKKKSRRRSSVVRRRGSVGMDEREEFQPSLDCIERARWIAIMLTITTMLCSVGFSVGFLTSAAAGIKLCELELGTTLFRGAFPQVVLLSGGSVMTPFCNLSRIVTIDAPWLPDPSNDPSNATRLQSLPSTARMLVSLEHLDVSGHNISHIPVELLRADSALVSLSVEGNPVARALNFSGDVNVTRLPIKIVSFFQQTLEDLDLSHTSLACFPLNVSSLSKLRRLDLTSTRVEYVPPYALLPKLRNLGYFESGPQTYPNHTLLLNNTPAFTSLDWSNEFRADERAGRTSQARIVVSHLAGVLPNLVSINLANNDIVDDTFPHLNALSLLETIDLQGNLVSAAPWRYLDRLSRLDSLNLQHNRLQNIACELNAQHGMTCHMLERIRTMAFFSVNHNLIDGVVFGDESDRGFFQGCEQGTKRVMSGAMAVATFLISHVAVFRWALVFWDGGHLPGFGLGHCYVDVDVERVIQSGSSSMSLVIGFTQFERGEEDEDRRALLWAFKDVRMSYETLAGGGEGGSSSSWSEVEESLLVWSDERRTDDGREKSEVHGYFDHRSIKQVSANVPIPTSVGRVRIRLRYYTVNGGDGNNEGFVRLNGERVWSKSRDPDNNRCTDGWSYSHKYPFVTGGGNDFNLKSLLESANPDVLVYFEFTDTPLTGPFPPKEVTSKFQRLHTVYVNLYGSGGTDLRDDILDGLYGLPAVKNLYLSSSFFLDNGGGNIISWDWCAGANAPCPVKQKYHRPKLSSAVSKMVSLRELSIKDFTGDLPLEMFELPKLLFLRLLSLSLETQSFNDFLALIGRSQTLRHLFLGDNITWGTDPSTTSMERNLPDIAMLWANTPIERLGLGLRGGQILYSEAPVTVVPFLSLPGLTFLDVCGCRSGGEGKRTFRLVEFNSSLNANLTRDIGLDNRCDFRQFSLGAVDGACSWDRRRPVCEELSSSRL